MKWMWSTCICWVWRADATWSTNPRDRSRVRGPITCRIRKEGECFGKIHNRYTHTKNKSTTSWIINNANTYRLPITNTYNVTIVFVVFVSLVRWKCWERDGMGHKRGPLKSQTCVTCRKKKVNITINSDHLLTIQVVFWISTINIHIVQNGVAWVMDVVNDML